ncbi:hypothetical protein [Streptomyces luteireticuli]|uniref:Uncharacterized protein n=1 Tax=Streptomyces luteireticuli TaxID=173858 RepID=A0ABP3IWW9_9ACTN
MAVVAKPKGFEVFYLKTGTVVHTARGTDTRTLCNKPITGVRLAYTEYVTCLPCMTRVEGMAPAGRRRGAGRETTKIRGTGEKTQMTETGALTEEIRASIERVRSLASEGSEEALRELVQETEGQLKELKGAGSVGLRNSLREELTAALKVGSEGAGEDTADEPAGDHRTGPEETPVVLEGVVIPPVIVELIEQGAKVAAEAIKVGVAAGKRSEEVSQIQLAMRKLYTYKKLPDLLAGGKKTRDEAGKIYQIVRDQLATDDIESADALDSLIRSVQNKNSDVLVEYLRGLDADKEAGLEEVTRYYPDAATAYLKAKAKETPENPASLMEEVYRLYQREGIDLPRKGRTELERERRAAAKELEGQSKADDEKLTPRQRFDNYVKALTSTVDRAEKNMARLADGKKLTAAQKRKRRDELQALADRILAIKEQV